MVPRWFTSYQGPWNQTLVNKNLSQKSFKEAELDAITKQLNLMPKKGFPRSGKVSYGDMSVVIKSFVFQGFEKIGADLGEYYTPVLIFDILVMAKKRGQIRVGVSDMEKIYGGLLYVTYEENYPRSYPVFRIPKYFSFRPAASHSDHMYHGGKMCLFGDFGRSSRAWDSERDSAASAFGVAMHWLVWHERDLPRYGVSADDV